MITFTEGLMSEIDPIVNDELKPAFNNLMNNSTCEKERHATRGEQAGRKSETRRQVRCAFIVTYCTKALG